MKNELQNHPLNGIKLDALLNELVDHYGWDILAAQIPINCFTSYPSIKSSLKFLRKTVWARQRLEAFYLYQYCQYPRPSDEQHELPPRERLIDLAGGRGEPVVLSVDDAEFFDDPASGPLFPSKRAVSATQSAAKGQRKTLDDSNSAGVPSGGLSKGRVEAEDRIVKSESSETFAQPSVEKPATSTREANEEEAEAETRAQEASEKVAHNPWAKALDKLGESDAE